MAGDLHDEVSGRRRDIDDGQDRIDGIAIATRISTGTNVQITSITVLCELRDGVQLAPRREPDHRVDEEGEDKDADDRA